MEKCNEMSQEVDLYCTINILRVLQQLESEIAKVEQVLQYLEAGGTLYKIGGHEGRKFLKDYLYILYQFRAAVVKYCSTMLLKSLQVIFRRNDGRINTSVEVQLLKHGAILPVYLVKPLSLVKKRGIQQCGGCAERATMLSDGLHMIVPINTLTVCPVSTEAKKRPPKEKEGQNENTRTEPAAAAVTTTPHSANGVLDGAGPVVASVSKNNSHAVSEVDVAANFVTSGNGGSNALNLPLPNNSEEPLPQEVHSAPVLVGQQQCLECDVPVTTPSQDTNEHTTSDNPYQQPLYDDSGGHTILLSQLEMKTQAIVSFTAELSGDLYHQQSNHPSDDCPTPPIQPLAPAIDPVQESSHGQSNVTMLSTSCHANEVSSEEQFVITAAI